MKFTPYLARAAAIAVLASLVASAWAAGPKAYVGNFKDSTVSVIDVDAGKVLATVPVATGPDGIVITPDGASVFVSGASVSSVSVIDTAKDSVAYTIEVGKGPQGLAMHPGGKQLLVAVNGDDRVAFIDLASRTVKTTVPVPKPHTIAIRPDGTQAYVTSQEPGKFAVVVIDLATSKIVGNIALDKPPRDLEFSGDGKTLYLTLAGMAAVQVIDPASNKIVAQIPTGVSPHLAHHFAGTALGMVVVQGPGEIELFDPATNTPVRNIAVGKQPHWMDITSDSKKLLVSNEGSNSVSIVDLATDQTRTIDVGNAPRKVAVQRVASGSGTVQVSIANFAFAPAQTTITRGQSVSWSNDDGAPHGLVFKDGAPGNALLLPGQKFSRRFDQVGSYDYNCSVHSYMTGRIVVKAP